MRQGRFKFIYTALVLLVVHSGADVGHGGDEAFIGWQGETYKPEDAGGAAAARQDTKKWVETISWSPRTFLYHNFLSKEEVDHIVGAVEKLVKRSEVIDTKTGKHTFDNIRTSFGAPLRRGQDPIIAAVEARIAEWTRLPADHGEPIQVLRYQNGQQYDAHWDWFDDPTHPANSGENRAATVLMYLGDVEEGGETTLPLGKFIDEGRQRTPNPSECATKGSGLAVVPRKGDALLFWDMHVDGTSVDRAALHASCPTLKGTKWTATKWLHNRPYGGDFDALKQAASCRDTAVDCAARVAAGKCDSEAAIMLGLKGMCRRSCQDCVDCEPLDLICLRKNMRSLRSKNLQQQ